MASEVEIIVTAEDRASGVLSGVGGHLRTIGTVGLGLATAGVGALVGGFALAGGAAIDMNSQLETSTLQFETLMGDATRAEEHVASLFDFAAKTPFETGPIINASRQMQVFGGDALNTTENLTRVGDTAAAVGAPIEDISFWVGRAYAAIQGGQPFGEAAQNLMQMGAVSPAVVSEMNRLKEAGASSDEIFAVLQGHMDGFSGAMEKQAGTWQGLKSTITDNLNMIAANALRPFFDMVKDGMANLATWLQSPGVQEGIQRISEGFTTLITKVADFVMNSVIPFVQEHGEALKNIILGIGAVMLGTLIPAAVSLAISMAPIILIVGAIAGAVALLRAAWENNLGGIQEKVAAVWGVIQPLLQQVWDWLQVYVPQALESLRAFWVDVVWPAIGAAIEFVWPIISAILDTLINVIQTAVIPTIQDIYHWWVETAWPAISDALKTAWEDVIKPALEELRAFILDTLLPAIQDFARLWTEEIWPAIQDALKAAWEDVIKPIWETLKEWLTVTLPNAARELKGAWDSAIGSIRGIVEGVKRVWDNFVTAVQNFWNWLTGKKFKINFEMPDWLIPDIKSKSSIGGGAIAGASVGTGWPSSAAPTTVVNIDARGAARGVDRDLRAMIEQVLREYGVRADVRMRTI